MLTNRFRRIALALTVLSLLLFADCASLPLSISEEKKYSAWERKPTPRRMRAAALKS